MNKKRRALIIVGIILAVLLASAGTYALWLWTSNIDKNLVMNTITGLNDYIIYNGGDSKFVGNFQPADKFCQSENNTISFYKTGELETMDVSATIYLQVEAIGENIAASSDVYWVLTEGDNTINCDDMLNSSSVISYGNFNGFEAGESIELLSDIYVKNTETKYTIWIWIDNSSTNLSSLSGETIHATIWTQFEVLGKTKYLVNLDANGGDLDTEILVKKYTDVGNYTFTTQYSGDYKIELWGASGGGTNGGKGAYTSGNLNLEQNEKLYFYVGGQGPANATVTNIGGYNGGGYSGNNEWYSYGGGGATDVRLVSGLWNDSVGLRSRIMVAAGGAGTVNGITTVAGAGGGLIGGSGTTDNSTYTSYVPGGATQIGVGYAYGGTERAGSFGQGLQAYPYGYGGGGGSGYYGGNTGWGTTGSGGSSFISGHTGCVAIESSSSTAARSGTDSATCTTGIDDNLCSVHYSGKIFTDTVMIDGTGYNWTNAKGSLQSMPNPSTGTYSSGVGHSGNGAARISVEDAILVNYDKKYGNLPTPTKEGYTFLGWYTAPEGGKLVTNKTKMSLKENHTLYAQWSKYRYVVDLDANGGEIETEIIYTSSGESVYTVPLSGEYKLEVWGAQGGTANGYRGGYGGYSVGTINLSIGNDIYVNVGGAGTGGIGSVQYGGYNGGGNYLAGGTNMYSASGGGATHIATKSGVLSSFSPSTDLDKILIVAGGGGGGYTHTTSGYYGYGGCGGGYVGVNGSASSGGNYGLGGSQTTAGYAYGMTTTGVGGFGYGGDAGSGAHGSAGGGGYYGGGGSGGVAGQSNSAGGGGSGYIGNSLLTNKAMYCYSCSTSSAVDTLTYSTTNFSATPTSNYAKSGAGAAKITLIDSTSNYVILGQKYGTLPTPTRDGYTFLGWYTAASGGTLVTSDTVMNQESDHTLYARWQAN